MNLLEGQNDCYVQIFTDDSDEPDFTTPVILDQDNPRWDYCRVAVASKSLTFKVFESDVALDDIVGEATWSIFTDGNVRNHMLTLTNGYATGSGKEQLYIDATLTSTTMTVAHFCIRGGSFTNTENSYLNEGENDVYVDVRVDGSSGLVEASREKLPVTEVDFQTPAVADDDSPTWTDFCRTVAVQKELRFTIWDEDTISNDLLGETSWKVKNGDVSGHALDIHGGTTDPPATGQLTVDVTLLPPPKIITICISQGSFTNTESALLGEGENDVFVRVFIDDSPTADYVTPTVQDADSPSWTSMDAPDGYCRHAAVRSHVLFEIWDEDLKDNDLLGSVQWSVTDDALTSEAPVPISDGAAEGCVDKSCGWLYASIGEYAKPDPSLTVSFSARVTIGGHDNGFAADMAGEIDIDENSATLNIAHEGGWSPIPESPISSYLHQLFTTPQFEGHVALNVGGTYLAIEAWVLYTQPLVLIPGGLEFGGVDINTGQILTDENNQPLGPSINITLAQQTRNSTFNYTLALAATMRIGSGDGDGWPPLMFVKGWLDPNGPSELEVWTELDWQPLPSALPAFVLPPFWGKVRWREDGGVDFKAEVGPIVDIGIGSLLLLKHWVVNVEFEGAGPPAPPPPEGLSAGVSAAAGALGYVAPPAPPTPTAVLALNVSGGIRLFDSLEFNVTGALETRTGSAYLTIEHDGGWCPFASFGLDFCTPALWGNFQVSKTRSPVLLLHAHVFLSEPVVLIGPNTLQVTDRATATSEMPGVGGPNFGIRMFQMVKNGPRFFQVIFDGSVCVNMTKPMCLPVKVNVVKEKKQKAKPKSEGDADDGSTASRQLRSLRSDLPHHERDIEKARHHHDIMAHRRHLSEVLGKYYYAEEEDDMSSDLGTLHGRRAQGAGFGAFVFDGKYTKGDIKPLGALLPASLADVIVIKGTEATPIEFKFTIDPFGGDICNLLFELGATLQFTPPSILGLGQVLLPLTAEGCLAPKFAAIFTARVPAIHLPGDMVFDGLTLLLSTYEEVEETTISTVRGDKDLKVPSGMSMHWEGTSPLSVLCPVDVELSFTFQSSSAFGFSFGCPEFSLTLFDAPPMQIKSTNFIRFTAIRISAFVAPTEVEYSLGTSFQLATGASDCSRPTDAECVRADVSANVGIDDGMTFVAMQLSSSGVWIEPLLLRNFAILDPHLTLDVQIPPPPAVPIPRVVAWAANIYYKPDPMNLRSNWPSELIGADPTSETWPPNLDSYAYRDDEKAMRTCESFFLYEQWHDDLDDSILRRLGLPRFAIKLRIPRLTLIDVLMMYADIQLSAYAAKGIDVGGAPAAAATLLGAVKPFLQIEMSVDLELSLIEFTESEGGVAEWNGEPVHRGLKLNMTVEASSFLGFSFDFNVLANVRLPNPTPELQGAFIKMLGEFFKNPMGIVTGEVVVPDIGFTAGMSIEALATLPFFPSRLYFFGKITTSSFELRAAANFAAGPFTLDVTLEILVAADQLRLAFGGALDLGPLGSVSVYGEMQANPAFFALNGTFCKPMFGIPMAGSAAIDSRTGKFGFEARAVMGFFGLITLEGGIETNPAAPNGVHLRGKATISFESLNKMIDDLIGTIVRAIAGTSDPETSLVAKALKLLFLPLQLLVRGTLFYDNLAGSMGIELVLDIFGERTLGFSLPTPVRRRALHDLSAVGETMPDWPHVADTSLNATRRRALSSSCDIGPPEFPMSIGDIVDEVANTFNNLVAMASRIAPIDYSFDFEVNLIVLRLAGYVRFTLATSGHMSLELAAALYFIGIRIEGDLLLSTDGGIVSGRLYGAGETPKLCGACPVLKGSVEVKKTPPEEGSVVSIGMDLEMTMSCLVVRGSALLDTAGGLRSFLLEASNPMCLVDVLLEAIDSFVPGVSAILGDSLSVSVQRVRAFYSGALGAGLSLTIDAELMEQRKSLTLKASGSLSSVGDFLRMFEDNAMALIEAFDDVLNVVSLTFFDITLGHAPVSWSAEIGARNIAGTGKGITIGGSLQLANSAWARMGFFGGGFGVDMDNYVEAGGLFMGSTFSMFHIELALKVDATFRNPLAEDLAELVADVAESAGARDLLNGNNDGRSINKEAMADVKLLRDAACDLKESLDSMLGGLTASLGRINETDGSQLARRLPAVLASMDVLTTGILASLEHAASVREATESNDGLRALKRILERFIADAGGYFGDRSAAERVIQTQLAADSVKQQSVTMLLGLRELPARIRALVGATETLVEVLGGDTAKRLAEFTRWGVALGGVTCLLKKTPDLGSQLAAIEVGLDDRILESMRRIGHELRLATPIAPAVPPTSAHASNNCEIMDVITRGDAVNSSQELLARSTFDAYDSLCPDMQGTLLVLVRHLGQSGLASHAELTKAINARRFRRASAVLTRSNLCTSSEDEDGDESKDTPGITAMPAFCTDVTMTLSQGCSIRPRWVRRPDWLAAVLDVRLLGIRAPHPGQQTLALRIAVNTTGSVACPRTGKKVPVLLSQVQRSVNMTFHTLSAAPALTETLAMETVNAMHLLPNGMVSVRSSQVARWWTHHTPLFIDASTFAQAQADDVCARADAVPSPTLELVDDSQLHAATSHTPFPQTMLMSGQSQRPLPLVVEPSRVCWAMCHPGLSAISVGDGILSADVIESPLDNISFVLSSCLHFLRRDYATCTIEKRTADLRFAQCAGAPKDSVLHDWLHAQLLTTSTSDSQIALVLSSLDCEAFATAKARHCVCVPSDSAVSSFVEMRPIEYSVGMPRDPNATNRLADVVAVRERLLSLGYGRGFSPGTPPADSCEAGLAVPPVVSSSQEAASGFVNIEMQVRLMRVLLCAAAGVRTFEDQCDVARVNGNCAVDGVECPRLARTARDTCIRLNEPCANAFVAPGSAEHEWLRSHGGGGSGAPGWTTIPAKGDGFELAEGAVLFSFGTTWLVEALTMAGRRLSIAAVNESSYDLSAYPITVLAMSGREGGLLPDEASHQTGLDIRMRLPINSSTVTWLAVREHVSALEAAGFSLIQIKGVGETATCQWKPSLCVASRARIGEMIARVDPPSLAAQPKVPLILSSQLALSADSTEALLTVSGLDINNAEQIVRVTIGEHECKLELFELITAGFQLTAVCSMNESEGWLGGHARVTVASGGQGMGVTKFTAFLRSSSPQSLPPLNSTRLNISVSKFSYADVRPYDPMASRPFDHVGALHAPISPSQLWALQSKLHGHLPSCVTPQVVSKVSSCSEMSASNASSLAALISWPIATDVSTTVHDLLMQLSLLDPMGLGGGGGSIPAALKQLRAPSTDGCIATLDVHTRCKAGVHARFSVAGFLDSAADALITAAADTSQLDVYFTPLTLDVVTQADALPLLWQNVRDGIVAAMPLTMLEGASRFFAAVSLSSASLRYKSSAPQDSALTLTFTSEVMCSRSSLDVPLTLFASYVASDKRISRQRLEQVLSALPVDELIGAFTRNVTAGLDFNESVDIPRLVVEAAQPLSTAAPSAGGTLSSSELTSFFSRASVCELGMFVRYVELQAPARPSQLCEMATQWLDRAAVIKAAIAESAACGVEPAASQWHSLVSLEARIRTMHSHLSMSSCMRNYGFLSALHSSVTLPAQGVRNHLKEVDSVLGGLEAAWLADDSDEVNELLPPVVELLRGLDEWSPSTQQITNVAGSISGLLEEADDAQPMSVVRQLRSWGKSLADSIEGARGGLPDVSAALSRINEQVMAVFPRVERVADTLAGVALQVSGVVDTLSEMEAKVHALRPQTAFVALAQLDRLQLVDFDRISRLLDVSEAFVNYAANMKATMGEHRTRLDADCLLPSTEGCPLRTVRDEVAHLQELLAARPDSAPQRLAAFPGVVATVLGTLIDDLRTTSRSLARCAAAVSTQTSRLPAYLAAADDVVTGPALRLDMVTKTFFDNIDGMLSSADDVMASIMLLQQGKAMTEALVEAVALFTPENYNALSKETTKLFQFFTNFATELVTPELRGMVTFVRSLLSPAVSHITSLTHVMDAAPYMDYMLGLSTATLSRLTSATSAVDNDTVPRLATLAPDPEQTSLANERVFSEVAQLSHDLAGLLEPSSTCLADATCQASLQIRVRTMRKSSRELRRRLAAMVVLGDQLKQPLHAFLDLADLATALLPEMEIFGVWTQSFEGLTADEPASQRSLLSQQLMRALCKDGELRTSQGRAATPPNFFDPLSCTSINDMHLFDGPNIVGMALDQSAKASPLFAKLVESIRGFNVDMSDALTAITSLIDSGEGATSGLMSRSTAFTSSISAVNASFAEVRAYVANVQPIMDLKDGIVALEEKIGALSTSSQLKDMSYSTAGALRHFHGASAPPFRCINVPVDCEATLGFVPQIEASAAELSWDRLRSPGDVVPMTLLTGLGDGVCYLRAGADHVKRGLESLTEPLEKLIEFFVHGPAALRGEAAQCASDDTFCLATVPRANPIYRLISFPIFYLHFWSLGTPPPANPCKFVMANRFTIPGLWSMSSMQSSTLLGHDFEYRGFNQCSRYTHLLAYAPSVPGGCTASYVSFLATADQFGQVYAVHPIRLPNGNKYAGTLSGVAVSRELGTVWACGKEQDDLDFSLFTFRLTDVDIGFDGAPLSYITREIRPCHVATLWGMRGTPGKEACQLHWDKKKQWLWAGNTAQPGERGWAAAHNTARQQCEADSGGGVAFAMGPLVYSSMDYGLHVSSFTFLTDVLGDDYVSLARCDNFNSGSAVKPCKLEFHEVHRHRRGMHLTDASSTLTIRTPSGLGSLAHDTSLGSSAAGGGYFAASFIGMTSAHADDTALGGGEPEDRVFVFRTPCTSMDLQSAPRPPNTGCLHPLALECRQPLTDCCRFESRSNRPEDGDPQDGRSCLAFCGWL